MPLSMRDAHARGTAVKMLSGQASGEECNSGYALCDLTEVPNVSAALKRLESFAYVGLTSEWRLSICLFHAMFGGRCVGGELENAKPGRHSARTKAQILGKVKQEGDPYDQALYAAVQRRFRSDMTRYNVTAAWCNRVCPPGLRRNESGPAPPRDNLSPTARAALRTAEALRRVSPAARAALRTVGALRHVRDRVHQGRRSTP